MSVSTIEKAVLINTGANPLSAYATNYAVYQVDAGPEFQVGKVVAIAGCTTSTFNNATATIAAVGTFIVPINVNGPAQGVQTWTGFSVTINNAAIAIELEPTQPNDGAEGSIVGTATVTVTQ